MLKFWKSFMNAHADVASIIAAATTPELAELERQLDETLNAIGIIERDIPVWLERADRSINTPFVVKNDATMTAADDRVAELRATKSSLNKTAGDIRAKISVIKPAFTKTVAEGIAPIRARAANDFHVAVNAMYEAIALYNSTSEALKQADAADQPFVVPIRIPTLDHFVKKVAEDLA
jgi:hypothetical protein